MLVINKKQQGYKEHEVSSILFSFVEGATIIFWLENMKLYVSDIEESYKDRTIGHMGNSGSADL